MVIFFANVLVFAYVGHAVCCENNKTPNPAADTHVILEPVLPFIPI
jgi:hypothetical protein